MTWKWRRPVKRFRRIYAQQQIRILKISSFRIDLTVGSKFFIFASISDQKTHFELALIHNDAKAWRNQHDWLSYLIQKINNKIKTNKSMNPCKFFSSPNFTVLPPTNEFTNKSFSSKFLLKKFFAIPRYASLYSFFVLFGQTLSPFNGDWNSKSLFSI